MKLVKVSNNSLKNQGYEGLSHGNSYYPFDAEVRVTEAEADKLDELKDDDSYTIEVSEAKGNKSPASNDSGGPGGSDNPKPDPSGTARSQAR